MTDLTPRLRRRIEADFGGSADEVAAAVRGARDTERTQAAIVLIAQGDQDRLAYALRIAALDWRDLLMDAGLAHTDWPDRLDEALGD
ncbi:hypothetical protein [uncultured Nocardioides sp.]|uniref:hypothetical protein n=1 Tax=uncultured Nocardioides sp. TaxID=198441 RepID=UPI0026146ACA|nr:hypothetical protein [uncultured Nocardioides sp.]